MEIECLPQKSNPSTPAGAVDTEDTHLYGRQLDRNFSLLSICATGLVVGNTWVALGGRSVLLPSALECNIANGIP